MWTVLKRLWNLAAFRVQRPTFSNMVVRGEKKLVTWRGRQAGWNKRKIRREDERSVIVSDALFSSWHKGRGRGASRIPPTGACLLRRRVELSRSWEDFCLLLALFLLSWSLFVTCLPPWSWWSTTNTSFVERIRIRVSNNILRNLCTRLKYKVLIYRDPACVPYGSFERILRRSFPWI